MRAFAAAVVGGVCGAAVAVAVMTAWRAPAETSQAPDARAAETIARLSSRVERLERDAARRPSGEAGDVVAPKTSPAPAATPPKPDDAVDVKTVSVDDLALQADERHARDFDIAGAAKRYRELLARGGSPAQRRHWLICLGDCLVRAGRDDEAAIAYQGCIDASDEDHGERVGCMVWLSRRALAKDPAGSLRIVDRALLLETGRANRTIHELGAEAARALRQWDREIRELTWLVENLPSDADLDAWKRRIASARDGR